MTETTAPSLDIAPVRRGRARLIRAAVGLACLGLGSWLIISYVSSRVPDPSSADPDQLIGFIMSEGFNELSDAERRAYAEQMVQRYAEMDDEQRKLAEAEMAAFAEQNPDQVREQTIRFWKDYAVREAEQYVEVPPEERRAYLEAKVAGWRMIFGGDDSDRSPSERRERQARGDQRLAERLGPENQQKAAAFFQDEVLPRTSARDRALTTIMIRDIGQMMRE
jgi:hypothetical protein